MRILHLIYSLNVGGAERMVITLANYQAKSNQVGLCIINNLYSSKLLSELDSNIQLFLINRKKASRNILDVFQLNWNIFKFHPDILHIHDSDAILYIPIRHLYYTILTIHATDLPLKGYKLYNKTVAISKAVADNTEKRGLCKPEVIYNGILTSEIRQIKKKALDNKLNFRIVQVGRLEHNIKGQHLLLEALHHHLLVQPSLSEGFGLTVTEGMAAGIPVLVSDLPALLELTDRGTHGYYFKHNDVDALAQMLHHIIEHYEEALLLADKARQYVTANFDSNSIVKQYISLYNECIHKKHIK